MSARGKSIAYFGDLKGDFYVSRHCMIVPGAVTGGTSIPLPDYGKGAKEIKHAVKLATGTGDNAELTVVTATPSTGEIQLYDKDNVRCGDNTLVNEVLILVLGYDVKLQVV